MKHLPDEPDIRKMDDFFFGVGFLSPALLELVNGTTSIRKMPMMEVVIHQDRMFSVSNRRLCLYRLCEHLGILSIVKVKLLSSLPKRFDSKFTTPCDGEWVRVRRDGRICHLTLEQTTFGREEIWP